MENIKLGNTLTLQLFLVVSRFSNELPLYFIQIIYLVDDSEKFYIIIIFLVHHFKKWNNDLQFHPLFYFLMILSSPGTIHNMWLRIQDHRRRSLQLVVVLKKKFFPIQWTISNILTKNSIESMTFRTVFSCSIIQLSSLLQSNKFLRHKFPMQL